MHSIREITKRLILDKMQLVLISARNALKDSSPKLV